MWIWVVGLAVVGMGFGLGETSSLGFLLEATGPSRLLLAMVVWNQVFAVGYLIGPAVGGAVAQTLGFDAVGLLPLAIAVVVMVTLLRLPRAVEASAEPAREAHGRPL